MWARAHLRCSCFLATAALSLVSAPVLAEACVCERPPASACRLLLFADAIFLGTAVEVDDRLSLRNEVEPPLGFRARLRVEEVFLGLEAPIGSELVVDGNEGSDCNYVFEKSTRYVVYALRRKGRLRTHLCTGTKPLEWAEGDLKFLRGLAAAPLVGSVYGEIRVWEKVDMVSGLRIILHGQDIEREATTNENGRYEFGELPPGDYTLEVVLAGNQPGRLHRVKIEAHGCRRMNFYVKGKRVISEAEL